MALGMLSSALGGLGGFLGTPQGQAIGGGLASGGLGLLRQYLASRQPPSQEQLAQQQMLQQMQQQQPFQQVDFDPIRQEAMRGFQQETIPGIAERFTGMGGQRSSAFAQRLGGAGADLSSRLAALQSQHELGQQQAGMQAGGMNQQRLRDLASYLGGQQQLGLGSQQLAMSGQQLAQRRRESAMGGLGMMGRQAIGTGSLASQRAQAQANAALQGFNVAQGQQAQQFVQPGQQGWGKPAFDAWMEAAKAAAAFMPG